jgi:hypothetical protein
MPEKTWPFHVYDAMRLMPAISRYKFKNFWLLPNKKRNKMMHAKYGNMLSSNSPTKGRGKGKNKGQQQLDMLTPEIQEELFQKALKDSLPEAARRRMAPRLEPAEWNVPVYHHTELSNSGGICICPKQEIPDLIRQVGYTKSETAILCTQHPAEIGMKGYPAQELTCTFHVKDDDGTEKSILVRRFLVQLGFGQPVLQRVDGDLVSIPTPMHKVTLKLPYVHGWRQETCTIQSIAKILDARIPSPAYEQILVRQDQSATVPVHESEILNLLRTSGQEAVFLKLHGSSPLLQDADILWLPVEYSLDDALQLSQKDDNSLGVVSKNKSAPRYAIRFGNQDDLRKFAKTYHIEDLSVFGRWRLTGLPVQTGTVGAFQLLTARGWEIKEILFLNESQCSFLSSKRGNTSNMYFVDCGVKHPLQIKAVNAIARNEQAAANKADSSKTSPGIQSGRPQTALQKDAWTRSVAAKAAMQAPASPRMDSQKRLTAAKTGNTPEPKGPRTG